MDNQALASDDRDLSSEKEVARSDRSSRLARRQKSVLITGILVFLAYFLLQLNAGFSSSGIGFTVALLIAVIGAFVVGWLMLVRGLS